MRAEFTQKLDGIVARYELDLPITTDQLLSDLIVLDNPYEAIK